MADVSGLAVTPIEALQILDQMPEALNRRVWLLYRGNLPPGRYYTSGGLFEAPDPVAYRVRIQKDAAHVDHRATSATTAMENQFGSAEVVEAESISRQMFRRAQAEGKRVPTQEDSAHG